MLTRPCMTHLLARPLLSIASCALFFAWISHASANSATDGSDSLSPAALLSIKFKDYPELTGNYRISPSRTIAIPVVGRISIANMSAAELEGSIERKVLEIGRKVAHVTVEIARYRVFYVTGSVRSPGAIEWQPNLTILQAVALGGGMAPEFMVSVGTTVVQGRIPQVVTKSVDSLKRDLAALTRLRAIRDDAATIEPPRELIDLVGAPEAERLVRSEMTVLLSERETQALKLEKVRRGIASERNQIAALQKQQAQATQTVEDRKNRFVVISGLQKTGIITNDRLLEYEIKISVSEEKLASIRGEIARSTAALAALELQEISLERDHRSAALDQIARFERSAAQAGIDVDSGLHGAPAARNGNSETEYQVVHEGEPKPAPATSNTLVRPGDVVIVVGR